MKEKVGYVKTMRAGDDLINAPSGVDPVWAQEDEIMLNRQAYGDYLTNKKRNEKAIADRLWLLDEFNKSLNGNEITATAISAWIRPEDTDCRAGAIKNANEFLSDYAKFLESVGQTDVASVITSYYSDLYAQNTRNSVAWRRNAILPCPDDFKVNPKYLDEFTNDEFVRAFQQLQQTVASIYQDIEKTPFDWGYPDFLATDGYYNRVNDVLFGFVFNGSYHNSTITVDAKKFFASAGIKRHKKVELMIAGLENFGFQFENFSKKSESFSVTYIDNPHVMAVLNAYVGGIHFVAGKEWTWGKPRHSLSYHYVEDPAAQEFETVFHAEMEYASDKLKEIQYWLHSEAAKYGYTIDPNEPTEKGCILYKKGKSKRFLLVGENEKGIWTKTSFITAFETVPEQMRSLCDRFPQVFRLDDPGQCCHGVTPDMISDKPGGWDERCPFRMYFKFDNVAYLRCGLGNFVFEDLSFDDVKAILNLFKVEKNIKPCAEQANT
jgi:hypothetical protein